MANITTLYDPSLSLAENMALLRGGNAKEKDDADSALYYEGGMIQNIDIADEIDRLLRGH